jgi:Putative zinc-finger
MMNAEVKDEFHCRPFNVHFSIQHSAFSIVMTHRRCSDLVGLLADYVEHQLPPGVQEELQKHLERCPRCVAQLKTYESTLSLLRSIRDEDLPQELRCNLKSFVEKNCKN